MHEAQNCKTVEAIPPAAIIDNASATVVAIDSIDADYLDIEVNVGATDIALSALKVTECDTVGGTYTDVTGLIVGTSVNTDGAVSALPSATGDNTIVKFEIDKKGRQRFFKLVATFGNGTVGGFVAALAHLWRNKKPVTTATERGCAEVLRV